MSLFLFLSLNPATPRYTGIPICSPTHPPRVPAYRVPRARACCSACFGFLACLQMALT
jgi:hypothetical protein